MQTQDTIAAIATARGFGAISIIRISGDSALSIAKTLTKRTSIPTRNALLCSIFDSNGNFLDKAIIIYFQAPKSYTGEDIVEVQTHGGIVVADMILDEILRLGARLANEGEFTKRAYLNNKLDLSQAEAISALINAKSIDSAKILARTMRGEVSDFVTKLRGLLVEILAHIEVSIDYAEEDLPPLILDGIKDRLANIKEQIEKTLLATNARSGELSGFKLAIIGKPNVGKSSLLNRLLNYDRAIVSDIAGTTRDTIEESLRVGTHLVKIVDTAGIRHANDEIERIGIERTLLAIKDADIVLALFDGSKMTDDEDMRVLSELKRLEKNRLALLNKRDLTLVFDTKVLNDTETLHISCKEDISHLIGHLQEMLDSRCDYEGIVLGSKRQEIALSTAKEEIEASQKLLESGELELFAYHIKGAINAIASITGGYEYGELLDAIFGSFCLGK